VNEVTNDVYRERCWHGVITKQRAQKASNIAPPENKSKNTVTIVPPIKPDGYAIKTRKQDLEKALDEAEYHALATYVYRKINAIYAPKTDAAKGVVDSQPQHKLPYSQNQEVCMSWCRTMDQMLAPEHKQVLTLLIKACVGDCQFSEKEIGRKITGSKDQRQQIGGYKGYLKAISQALLENGKKVPLLGSRSTIENGHVNN